MISSTVEASSVCPPVPQTVADTGLSESLIESLILKILYFQSETTGQQLSHSLGLKFSVIQDLVEFLRRQHVVVVKRTGGIGAVSSIFQLTEAGQLHAREHLAANQYAGKAPVPLRQYCDMVRAQRWPESWLTMAGLRRAFQHMVVTPEVLSQVGPAVNAGKSLLIYGQPGNGKTFLAEALFHIDTSPVYIPHAIEVQGQIIQFYDPIYHTEVESEAARENPLLAFANETTYDMRWIPVKRPFIVSGGELDMHMLDLNYNEVAKFYDAPLHLRANNGVYLIDDFGRQRCTPAEVLNRWIVPMERRYDFLAFKNGNKFQAPFETLLLFSSNLNPQQLGDEAFLRRIQYKLFLRNPSEEEYREIFRRFAAGLDLPFDPGVLDRLIEKRYRATGKKKRRCHPRDILTHAVDLVRFEKREWRLTDEVLDHAFETCFLDVEKDE